MPLSFEFHFENMPPYWFQGYMCNIYIYRYRYTQTHRTKGINYFANECDNKIPALLWTAELMYVPSAVISIK